MVAPVSARRPAVPLTTPTRLSPSTRAESNTATERSARVTHTRVGDWGVIWTGWTGRRGVQAAVMNNIQLHASSVLTDTERSGERIRFSLMRYYPVSLHHSPPHRPRLGIAVARSADRAQRTTLRFPQKRSGPPASRTG